MTNDVPYETKLQLAHERIRKKGEVRAQKVNKNKTDNCFKEGDMVLVKANNVSDAEDKKIAKFFAIYEGPYVIKKEVGAATYLLMDTTSSRERGKFHACNLKRYLHAREEEKPAEQQ